MNFKRIISAALIAMAMAGCTKYTVEKASPIIPADDVYVANVGTAGTKTVLDGKSVLWQAGDQISIFTSWEHNANYILSEGEGTKKGKFVRKADGKEANVNLKASYAVYPYSDNNEISRSKILYLELPFQQKYVEGGFSPEANPMVAVTSSAEDKVLDFKNTVALMKIEITGDQVIKSVRLDGLKSEKLSGKFSVDIVHGEEPDIVLMESAMDYVFLDCSEDQVMLNDSKPSEFYLAVSPVTFMAGFKITVTTASDEVFEYNRYGKLELKRNSIYTVKDINCVGPDYGDENWETAVFPHRSLLLQFAATHSFLSSTFTEKQIMPALEECKDNLELINLHIDGDLRNVSALELSKLYKVITVPGAIVDGRMNVMTKEAIVNSVHQTEELYDVTSNFSWSSSWSDDVAYLALNMYFKEPDTYKVSAFLVEDDVENRQEISAGIYENTYIHSNVFRTSFTHVLGDDIVVENSNQKIFRTFNVKIPSDCNKDKLKILVYVQKPYGNQEKESNGDFGDYYIDNAASAPISQVKQF